MIRFRITSKFVLWFLFVALVPLVIATYISYDRSRKALEEEVAKSLLAVADNKANQIEVYLKDKEKNVSALAHMSETVTAIEGYIEASLNPDGRFSEAYRSIDDEYGPFLTYYQNTFGYENLFFINPNGQIVFSIKPKKDMRSLYEIALYENSGLAKVFIRAKDSLMTEISHFEYSAEWKKPVAYVAAPVSKGAELIGVVALEVGNDSIVERVNDYSGLGRTGETVAATLIDNKAVVITPLRFNPHAEFTRKVTIGSNEDIDMQRAVQGKEGLGLSVDYRGKPVMSAWKYLPLFKLGLVVKMDTEEIFSSANRLRDTLMKISLALLALVVIMAVAIARTVSSPIKGLTRVSAVITSGDLSARAETRAGDEIGDLARSFNQMTDSLVEAKAKVEEKKEEVEEQKKLLEKANKELDSFVYTASHDLRAPLRAISSFASFLEEDYKDKLDDEGKSNIKEIIDGASRMNKLIEDLLTLSRITRIQNPYEDVNINTLVTAVLKQIEFNLKEQNVDVKVLEYLPTVHCDRIKISTVFLNLISNAAKFSSKNNKEKPAVEVGFEDTDKAYKFFVKDNGIGIDPQYHKQIFGIFKRLHSAEEYDGTGAGLSIVKRIIDDHSGDIWVESEVGKGARFCFTIPKALEKEKKKKIGEILVEDGAITKKQLEEGLKKQDHGAEGPPEYREGDDRGG
jgi:signal transduction histidine kinase